METDLNKYINKKHIKAVERFNNELENFRKETGEEAVTLYEDPFTCFTLKDVRVENGHLVYEYDGNLERDLMVRSDEETGEIWEEDCIDSIMNYLRFWRACLKRAKSFWSMDPERLDAIQNAEVEYHETEEEE